MLPTLETGRSPTAWSRTACADVGVPVPVIDPGIEPATSHRPPSNDQHLLDQSSPTSSVGFFVFIPKALKKTRTEQ